MVSFTYLVCLRCRCRELNVPTIYGRSTNLLNLEVQFLQNRLSSQEIEHSLCFLSNDRHAVTNGEI